LLGLRLKIPGLLWVSLLKIFKDIVYGGVFEDIGRMVVDGFFDWPLVFLVNGHKLLGKSYKEYLGFSFKVLINLDVPS
jgi:hypothetical protein